MSSNVYLHAIVPYGTSLTSRSVDELVRPNLRRAYLPPSEDDPRFERLLDALKQRQEQTRSA